MWAFIVWIVIGALAGWVASKIRGTDAQQGLLLDIIVGVIGGLIGGWLLGLFGIDLTGSGMSGLIGSFLTALLGAVILIWLVQLVTRKR